MPGARLGLLLASLSLAPVFLCGQSADLAEIERRGTAVIQSDWAAGEDWSYVERDELWKGGRTTSTTYRWIMIDGSGYSLQMAVNDQALSPEAQRLELDKLRAEIARRKAESPEARRQRIASYRKSREENGNMLLDFPTAFTFQVLREETLDRHPAWVLSATPKPRKGPLSRAARVLAGMQGAVWIDRATFHAIRGECVVLSPVPVYGILAQVMPGTHVELEMSPVNENTWLISRLTIWLTVSKFFWFRSNQVTRSTFTEYKLNDEALRELLSEPGPK